MAKKRMFSLQIVDTDAFLDMPLSTQALYFHLSMRADDDGFVDSPKKITKLIGANDDDFKLLLTKRFILGFENGIIVIKHWRINNYIRTDRYSETMYLDQKKKLVLKDNGAYSDVGIPNVNQMDTQYSIDKSSIDNNSKPSLLMKNTWQYEALEAIKILQVDDNKKSSIFKCFKDNRQKAKIALDDCKELGKLKDLYFLKVYNELKK